MIILSLCSIFFAFSTILLIPLIKQIPLNIQAIAWHSNELINLLILEVTMFLPFLAAGIVLGLVLMGYAENISGHYASNLIGCGVGGMITIAALNSIGLAGTLWFSGLFSLAAGILFLNKPKIKVAIIVLVTWFTASILFNTEVGFSQYKMISLAKNIPDTRFINTLESSLGRIDIIQGSALHYAPGISLHYQEPLPEQLLMLFDGDGPSPIYNCKKINDWRFLDYTTSAAAYYLIDKPETLIIGAGGGSHIGLGLYHNADITALEMNKQIVELMSGPLMNYNSNIYNNSNVKIIQDEARGYIQANKVPFDIIQIPLLEAFGSSGSGLISAEESYLYTTESFELMLSNLSPGGILSLTRWSRYPPRDGIRIFNTLRASLKNSGFDAEMHLAMIRNWSTVTILAFKSPITLKQEKSIRSFCTKRGFDIAYIPNVKSSEINKYHILKEAPYANSAKILLSEDRNSFERDYLYNITPSTDDSPYHFHTFRWLGFKHLQKQIGKSSLAFVEIGTLLLFAGVIQIIMISILLLILPMVIKYRNELRKKIFLSSTLYFSFIGLGFMLLEISLLQKLILYLSNPVYAAAGSISAFLIFSGLGSLSTDKSNKQNSDIGIAVTIIISWIFLSLFCLDNWLSLTQSYSIIIRFIISAVTIAPLAFSMGKLFPVGLKYLQVNYQKIVPWAWSVNGFASVLATSAAPLIAMTCGFRIVLIAAGICYISAGIVKIVSFR
ncbi:MAG: hypothetical protein ACYTFY_16900 [Planctomycetota bacterium]